MKKINETEQMKIRYEKRSSYTEIPEYAKKVVAEREFYYEIEIKKYFSSTEAITLLEIGAGSGGNLEFFKSLGIKKKNIFANELLENRISELKKNHTEINVFSGDALIIPETFQFDIVFQSTVFTSILDSNFRNRLADKMWKLTKPGGIILWYDFIFDNPKNPDVKKVSVKELKALFPNGEFIFEKKVTLAPPIGRRVGKFYSFFNLFPFLRSHYIAVIKKK